MIEMNTIYVITNQVNGKQYVGKTCKRLEDRFREHQCCAKQSWLCERPLYRAMQKYGKENFSIKALEEVDDEHVDEQEIFWIEKLGTYGVYNATKGGEGYRQLDENTIIHLYKEQGSIKKTSRVTGHSPKAISKCLHKAGIFIESPQSKSKRLYCKPIAAIDNAGNRLCFASRTEAARWVITQKGKKAVPRAVSAHICDAANGKYKTAYGCVWEDTTCDGNEDSPNKTDQENA